VKYLYLDWGLIIMMPLGGSAKIISMMPSAKWTEGTMKVRRRSDETQAAAQMGGAL